MTVRELIVELFKMDMDKDVVMFTKESVIDIGKVAGERWGLSDKVVYLVEEGEE